MIRDLLAWACGLHMPCACGARFVWDAVTDAAGTVHEQGRCQPAAEAL